MAPPNGISAFLLQVQGAVNAHCEELGCPPVSQDGFPAEGDFTESGWPDLQSLMAAIQEPDAFAQILGKFKQRMGSAQWKVTAFVRTYLQSLDADGAEPQSGGGGVAEPGPAEAAGLPEVACDVDLQGTDRLSLLAKKMLAHVNKSLDLRIKPSSYVQTDDLEDAHMLTLTEVVAEYRSSPEAVVAVFTKGIPEGRCDEARPFIRGFLRALVVSTEAAAAAPAPKKATPSSAWPAQPAQPQQPVQPASSEAPLSSHTDDPDVAPATGACLDSGDLIWDASTDEFPRRNTSDVLPHQGSSDIPYEYDLTGGPHAGTTNDALPRQDSSDEYGMRGPQIAVSSPERDPWYQTTNGSDYATGAPAASSSHYDAHMVSERLFPESTLRKYPGIANQGATCYLNSLLQVLVNIPYFRVSLYKMPVEDDTDGAQGEDAADTNGAEGKRNIPLALQRLVYEIEMIRESGSAYSSTVSTTGLTASFGWSGSDVLRQHDAQELLRVLTDSLSERMEKKNKDPHSNFIRKLFRFEIVRYTRCLDIDYESTNTEVSYDLTLAVSGKASLLDSFEDYFKEEVMDGDNKYQVEFKDGRKELHRAARGARFRSLPPVLMLHLNRFEFDPYTGQQKKVNDRFTFPKELNLSHLVEGSLARQTSDSSKEMPREGTSESFALPHDEEYHYDLHAVTVHSGTIHGGHYWCYAKPEGPTEPWAKFNDSVVSSVRSDEAVEGSFGADASPWGYSSYSSPTTAYLLTYVRKSCVQKLFSMPSPDDLQPVHDRFREALRIEAERKKERDEAHKFLDIIPIFASDLCSEGTLQKTPQGLSGAVQAKKARYLRTRGREGAEQLAVRLPKESKLSQLRASILSLLQSRHGEESFCESLNNAQQSGRPQRTIRLWKIDPDNGKITGGCRTPIITESPADAWGPAGSSQEGSQSLYCQEQGAAASFRHMEEASGTSLESCFGYVSSAVTEVKQEFCYVEILELDAGGNPPGAGGGIPASMPHVPLLTGEQAMRGEGGLVFVKQYNPFAEDSAKLQVVAVVSCDFASTTVEALLRASPISAARGGSGGGSGSGSLAAFVEASEKNVIGLIQSGSPRGYSGMTVDDVLKLVSDSPSRRSRYSSWGYSSQSTGYPGWGATSSSAESQRREVILIVQEYHSEQQLEYLMHPELEKAGGAAEAEGGSRTPRGQGTPLGAMRSPPSTPVDLHLFGSASKAAAALPPPLVPAEAEERGAAAPAAAGGALPAMVFSCRDYFLETLHRMAVLLDPFPYEVKADGSIPLAQADPFTHLMWHRGVRAARQQQQQGVALSFDDPSPDDTPVAAAALPPAGLQWTSLDVSLRKCETVQQAAERVARRLRKHYLSVFDSAFEAAGGGASCQLEGSAAAGARQAAADLTKRHLTGGNIRLTVHKKYDNKPDTSHLKYPNTELSDVFTESNLYTTAPAGSTGAPDAFTSQGYHRLYFELLPTTLNDAEDMPEAVINIMSHPAPCRAVRLADGGGGGGISGDAPGPTGIAEAGKGVSSSSRADPIFQPESWFRTEVVAGGGGGAAAAQPGEQRCVGQHYLHLTPAARRAEEEEEEEEAARGGYRPVSHEGLTVAEVCRWALRRQALLRRVQAGEEDVAGGGRLPAAALCTDRVAGEAGGSASLLDYCLVITNGEHEIVSAVAADSSESVNTTYCRNMPSSYSYYSYNYTKPSYAWYLLPRPKAILPEGVEGMEMEGVAPPSMLSNVPRSTGYDAVVDASAAPEEVCVPVARVAVEKASKSLYHEDDVRCFGAPFVVNILKGDKAEQVRRRVAEQLLGGPVEGVSLLQSDLPIYTNSGNTQHACNDADVTEVLPSLRTYSYYKSAAYLCCSLPIPEAKKAPVVTASTSSSYKYTASRGSEGVKFK